MFTLTYYIVFTCKYRKQLLIKYDNDISEKYDFEIIEQELRRDFWKEKTFGIDGYFVSTIGEISNVTLKHYIKKQG